MVLFVALAVLWFTSRAEGTCCKDNWIRHGNSCYLFIGTKETWMEASQMCAARGATLAAVETAEENAFLRGYLKVFTAFGAVIPTWIGGNDMEIEGQWKWSPDEQPVGFTDWNTGEPQSPDGGDCMIMWPGMTITGQITLVIPKKVSCVNLRACCQDNWIRYGNSCYLFIGTKETWLEASQQCSARRASLAAVETADESAFIRGYLKVFAGLGADMTTWIGGTDTEIEGIWKWSPSGEKMTYTDWFPGQPDQPDGGDCLVIWPGHSYHWGDLPCHDQESFLCEMPIESDPVVG